MIADIGLVTTSMGIGVAYAMDAFSVSLANGLSEPQMKKRKMAGIAGVFSAFQFAMPMIGWICVSTIAQQFKAFEKFIPWIAFVLLGYIGGKMLIEGIKTRNECSIERPAVGFGALVVQGIATSIDALSGGFTIAHYNIFEALISCAIIGGVTFIICYVGIIIGKKSGTCLAGKANILGGAILIAIGLKIFIESFL